MNKIYTVLKKFSTYKKGDTFDPTKDGYEGTEEDLQELIKGKFIKENAPEDNDEDESDDESDEEEVVDFKVKSRKGFSEAKNAFADHIEAYAKQNPRKFKLKREALMAKLDAME